MLQNLIDILTELKGNSKGEKKKKKKKVLNLDEII